MTIQEIFDAVAQKKLKERTRDELTRMALGCRNLIASGHYLDRAKDAVTQIEQELRSRELDLQQMQMLDQQKEMLVSIQEVKEAIGTLTQKTGKHHWTVTPGFWVGVVVLIVASATLWIAYLSWQHPKEPEKQSQAQYNLGEIESNAVAGTANTVSNAVLITNPAAIMATSNAPTKNTN